MYKLTIYGVCYLCFWICDHDQVICLCFDDLKKIIMLNLVWKMTHSSGWRIWLFISGPTKECKSIQMCGLLKEQNNNTVCPLLCKGLMFHPFWLNTCFVLQTYLQIILESLPAFERSSTGIHGRQAAKLQELVEYIQSQVRAFFASTCQLKIEVLLSSCFFQYLIYPDYI